MSKQAFKAVILAGGSGERFWPLSTSERPKQFLNVFGGESLIRQAVSRLDGLVAPKDVFVVTTKSLVAATRKELPELPKANILGEPMRRDTGAAVALGVGLVVESSRVNIESSRISLGSSSVAKTLHDPKSTLTDPKSTLTDPKSTLKDPIIGFFSSDQMVAKPKEFRKVVKKAIAIAQRKPAIVTIGIKPDYPATSFGYISPKTRTFVEKPDAKTAKKYVKAGYLWNAGMFIARASTFRGAFAAHAPELSVLVSGMGERPRSTASGRGERPARPLSPAALAKIYAALPRISFDYAVMEKAKNVEVVPGDFGWDDVGSYMAFDKYFPRDERGNVRDGACTLVESDGNICVSKGAPVSLLGVKNLVVVTTPTAVLVVDKSHLGEMKKLFAK